MKTYNEPPTIGKIVHFVLEHGAHRPALITNAWDEPLCNLTVMLDQSRDLESDGTVDRAMVNTGRAMNLSVPGTIGIGSVAQDEDDKAPGTWHWPERVERAGGAI